MVEEIEKIEKFIIQHLHPKSYLSLEDMKTWMSQSTWSADACEIPEDATLIETLARLQERGLVRESDETWRLTAGGRSLRDRFNREDRRNL